MKTDEWNKLIRDHFCFLFEKYGFEMASSNFYPEHFGIRITNLESNNYIIEFELDRGTKLLITIGPKHTPSMHYYLRTIVEYLNKKPIPWLPDYDIIGDEQIIEQIKSNYFR